MKRPEGFDRPATPVTPPPRRPAASRLLDRPSGGEPARPDGLASDPARPERARPESEIPLAPAPDRPRERRAPAVRRPSAARTAKAELRAAERMRRRHERREVRRFTRGARRRRLGWTVTGLVVASLVAMITAAVFSPVLALRQITVQGTSRLDAQQLRRAVDGQLGTPLALIDRDRITRELRPFSLIRSYAVEIVPPDGIVIHVVERVPVAALETASGFQLVDPAGVPVADSQARPDGVPVIQLAEGHSVRDAAFRSMAEVLLALPPDLLAKVDTVSATTRDDVGFTVRGTSQRVVWGTADDSAAKAQTLAAMPQYRAGTAGTLTVTSPGAAIFRAN